MKFAKVMFSWVSVHSGAHTHPRYAHPPHACPLGMHAPSACTPPGNAHPPADTTRCAQWSGGTHPTGMHSCYTCAEMNLFQAMSNCWRYIEYGVEEAGFCSRPPSPRRERRKPDPASWVPSKRCKRNCKRVIWYWYVSGHLLPDPIFLVLMQFSLNFGLIRDLSLLVTTELVEYELWFIRSVVTGTPLPDWCDHSRTRKLSTSLVVCEFSR